MSEDVVRKKPQVLTMMLVTGLDKESFQVSGTGLLLRGCSLNCNCKEVWEVMAEVAGLWRSRQSVGHTCLTRATLAYSLHTYNPNTCLLNEDFMGLRLIPSSAAGNQRS